MQAIFHRKPNDQELIMTETTTPNATSNVSTRHLSVPGAELTYDVHGDLATASTDRPACS